jgi:hypothetical protein
LNWKLIILIALIGYGAVNHFSKTSVQQFSPTQQTADGVVQMNGYHIKPLEPFELHARVLSTKRYTSGKEADLAPVDLALGWGKMADSAIINQITITQSNRWYRWQVQSFPIPRREIETNSANMHLIPSSPAIAEAIQSAKVGQMVKFTGDLVEVTEPQGNWRWRSSLTRTDTGAGACELVLVKSFSVL